MNLIYLSLNVYLKNETQLLKITPRLENKMSYMKVFFIYVTHIVYLVKIGQCLLYLSWYYGLAGNIILPEIYKIDCIGISFQNPC